MKTWYCVTTSYDDKGRVTAGIVNIREANRKPKNSYKSTLRKDIYIDWFDGLDAAQQYVCEVLLV